jgi:hypothetical protein
LSVPHSARAAWRFRRAAAACLHRAAVSTGQAPELTFRRAPDSSAPAYGRRLAARDGSLSRAFVHQRASGGSLEPISH